MTALLRMAGYQDENSVHTRALRELDNQLDSKLFASAITANITTSGKRAADLLSLTATGDLEICYFAASYLSHVVPEIQLWDLPFLISDRSDGYDLFDGALGEEIRSKLEADGHYRVLGCWDNGFRHLTSSMKPIRSRADCEGQRIRTMGNAPQHDRIFSAMGFTPVPLDVRELMPAILSGAVAAQENPLTNIWNFGIHEQHRWITLTGHLFGPSLLLCNGRFYDQLNEQQRENLDNAVTMATTAQRKYAAADDESITIRLAETNTEVITLNSAQIDTFRQAVEPLVEEVLADFSPDIREQIPL